jgi:hypothetical protein
MVDWQNAMRHAAVSQQSARPELAMSKIVKTGIIYFFSALVQKIFRGRIIPTVIGAIIGGSVGSLGWYLHSTLMPPLIFLGLIVGAAIAAAIFPKPEPLPTSEESQQN